MRPLERAPDRRQDRHRADRGHPGRNEKYNAVEDGRAQARPFAVHGLRAAGGQPTIALAIVVENAGFGSAAAPISRRVFDYVIAGHGRATDDIALTREAVRRAGGQAAPTAEVPLPGHDRPPAPPAPQPGPGRRRGERRR